MAVIKAVNSKASIAKAINYVTKEEKTEERLVSGRDCNPSTAIDEMKATKELWNKTGGRQYAHIVQSFNPEDNITPEKAHELGKRFIEENAKFNGHEVVIATHKDKDHIHNHFIVNSVNFETGKKLHTTKKELEQLKEYSNQLSRENGLTVPTKGESITTFSQDKYQAILKGATGKEPSYLLDAAKDISNSLKVSADRESFIKNMEQKGYQVNWKDTRKNITFTTPGGKKVRSSNLEKTFKQSKFSKEGIENEIRGNRERTAAIDRSAEPGTTRTHERNQRTQSTHEGLHKGSHGRGHSEKSNTERTTGSNNKHIDGNSKEDGFDFEKARRHSSKLRQDLGKSYGQWKEGNAEQQPGRSDQDGRDRKKSGQNHDRDEKGHGQSLKKPRTKNFDLTR